MPTYNLTPQAVPRVDGEFRKIATDFPVPESVPLLERLHASEPVAMQGQPPVLWDRAEGFQVYDRWGNCWIDWSSGVVVTNSGHAAEAVVEAIQKQVASKLLTSYCFPNESRLALVERLVELLPAPLQKVFLLTTGSETVECAVKICRTQGAKIAGPSKNIIVSFEHSFHGRTLGSQQAGGIPALKTWIGNLDPGFVQVKFPDGFRCQDVSFQNFKQSIKSLGVDFGDVAGVILETYQGGDAAFAPVQYMQELRQWCDEFDVVLVCDEVQAGFGRTGTMWGFEHYGIVPDLACFGKGISGSLPLSAVAGKAELMDLHAPGSMTSTHSGNPVCCAAALANIETIVAQDLVGNSRRLGEVLHARLKDLAGKHEAIATVMGRGLVAGVVLVDPASGAPGADLAFEIVLRSLQKGLLMFSPVGFGGGTVKIAPPLSISEAGLEDGLRVFEEAVGETLS